MYPLIYSVKIMPMQNKLSAVKWQITFSPTSVEMGDFEAEIIIIQ